MNWGLLFRLSLIGLAMAFATIWFIPFAVEPAVWAVIFIICGLIITIKVKRYFFWHGFALSIINSVWITLIHLILYREFIDHHENIQTIIDNMPCPTKPRIMLLACGPTFGVILGLIQGLVTLAIWRFKKL